jgi:hypothetical protein
MPLLFSLSAHYPHGQTQGIIHLEDILYQPHTYTPPGCSKDAKHPVLYLLHEIGDTERGWSRTGATEMSASIVKARPRLLARWSALRTHPVLTLQAWHACEVS